MKSQPLWTPRHVASPTSAWRLPICMAPSLTSAWRLSICKAPSPRHMRGSSSFPHGAPCVHQLPKVAISSSNRRFQRNVAFLSSRLSRCPTTRAARRHNAGGVFLRHPTASSPTCPSYLPLPFSSRHTAFTRDRTSRTTRERDGTARRNFACTSTRPPDGHCQSTAHRPFVYLRLLWCYCKRTISEPESTILRCRCF